MSSIAKNIEKTSVNAGDAPPLPRGVMWIDVELAAARLNLKERAIRDRCKDQWWPAGRAKLERPADGGKARWLIRTDADPALANIPLPAYLPVEVSSLTGAQRAAMQDRAALLREWEEAKRAAVREGRLTQKEATELFLSTLKAERGIEISSRTLQRWYRCYRKDGANGLKDGRWDQETKVPIDDPFLSEVRRLYMRRDGGKVRYCCKLARQKAAENGWTVCSYKTALRHINAIPLAQKILAREGEKAYADKVESYIERDYAPVRSNELWNSDHHEMDVLVRVGEEIDKASGEVKPIHARPWLTVWQDYRSRKIMGYDLFAGDPCTDNILISFRCAAKAHGLPETIWVDNGRDYDAHALHGRTKKERRARVVKIDREHTYGVFAMLNIKARNVQTYHGQSKPIERVFLTLEEQFGKGWDTYCGRSPENRPEGLQERIDAGKAPTLEEFRQAFAAWVDVYNSSEHTGDGMEGKSPDVVFAENLVTKRTLPDAELDVLTLKPGKPVKVGRNGVRWNGVRYGKYNEILRRRLGQMVYVAGDPKDVKRVAVYTLNHEFICAVDSNERLPANADAPLVKEAMARKRASRKADKAYRQTRFEINESLHEIMMRIPGERLAAARRQDNPDPHPPASISPIRSPMEGQAERIQKALKAPVNKVAAGAESLDIYAFANENFDLPTRPALAGGSSRDFFKALNDAPADAGNGG